MVNSPERAAGSSDFYECDPAMIGSKGLVLIGNELLTYRRDNRTDQYPGCLDLPGGGPEGHETPFEVFQREVAEEFGLAITPENITYVRRYESRQRPGRFAYFPVAQLPAQAADHIRFGQEGSGYSLVSADDYISAPDAAWPVLQDRTRDYLRSLQ